MEIASTIVTPVVNALTVHITQKLRYITSSADLVEEMGKKMKVLEGQRIDNKKKMRRNRENRLETPTRVKEWLAEVKKIKKEVDKILPARVDPKRPASTSTSDVEDVQEGSDNFPSNNIACFDVKKKYRTGRDALKLTKDIEALIEESNKMIWRDNQIPLGRVDSKRPASTSSSGGNTQTGFKSRDKIFNDALKFLQDDDKTRVIALCGMGGVGKTTLMNQLYKAAYDNKMFNWIVVVLIGKTPNLHAIQKAIAAHTGKPLTETDETLMATYLLKRFEALSEEKEKCLVILDDVWKESKIKLKDIGLARPLPKGVKLLLTSRDESICREIAVDAGFVPEVVRVDVLKEGEARDLFCRIADISAENDRDLYKIGCDIVKKCGYLPLAIEIIAATLIRQRKSVWKRTLKCLKNNKNVLEIIEISCKSLKQEDKAIFLLCGLFPEDSNIPIEDLTRYAWGLKLLKEVDTIEDARDSTQTSVSNLKNAYLLMDGDSDDYECVKMHDLVLAFAVATVSKGGEEGCWIIHHDDFSKSSEDVNMSQSCKQISLTCKGMSEFPSEFKFPNLSLLKLMHGDESLRFPQDFYEAMKKLQVIAFEKLEYPVVPTSFQCSTSLRTLCLDECSLMLDLTCIGNLSNLEVLSFANSGITILPSTFGNLKKLRLLDATGCYNLVIDDGVLKNMVKLEELYMIASDETGPCCFTENNCNKLAERSEHLSALEFEFINNAHRKNMSFKKLNRFKLSVGCSFTEVRDNLHTDQVEMHSYENSLKLDTSREELLTSKINELFEKTDALYLQVNDMNTLEDVDVESPHPRHHPRNSSFYNLRLLVVSECAELKYLFTMNVAKNLSKLEYLEISNCRIMEAVIHTKNDELDIIKFSNLKYLRLAELSKLSSFCDKVNVIELPRLVEFQLRGLQSCTSIYPSSASSSVSTNISRVQSFFHEEDATPKLEKLFVSDMQNLKEIWPPQFSISNLCQLRELRVEGCDSIEVLFNMDFGEIEQLRSSLRSIKVLRCDSLVKLFSCNPFLFFNNLQELTVSSCGSIQVLFNTDLGRAGKSEEQVCSSSLRSIKVWRCDSLVNLLPRNPMPLFNHLEELDVSECASVEVIFDIDMGCVGKTDKVSSSSGLRSIQLVGLGKLREVWRIKDGGNNLIHGFEAVEIITIRDCERFENIITPAATNFDMRALKQVSIYRCGRERERNNEMVESKQDQEIDVVSKVAFPSYLLNTFHHLHKLSLSVNKAVDVAFEIMSPSSSDLASRYQQTNIYSYLEEIRVRKIFGEDEVTCGKVVSDRDDEDASINFPTNTTFFPYLDILKLRYLKNFKCIGGCANGISADISLTQHISYYQVPWSLCQYAREISITECDVLPSVIPWYAVGQMQKLQVLKIINCKSMTEVFETQEVNNKSGTDTGKSLPRLEHITMLKLPKLKILKIKARLPSYESISSYRRTTMEQLPWSYQNLIEVDVKNNPSCGQTLFSSDKLLQLQKLETIYLYRCWDIKEIFDSQTVDEIPNLKQVDLAWLISLKYIWKSNQGTLLKFPNLTRLSIDSCESILQLQELHIKWCESMKEIVKGEEECDDAIVVFPCLKSLKLYDLDSMEGFCLGKETFEFPSLDTLKIDRCRIMRVFTKGDLSAPKLYAISKWGRKFNVHNRRLNFPLFKHLK
ncbi:NB-ARC domains-containing protein [Tanacetum coccineum]